MVDRARVRAEADRLSALFQQSGAEPFRTAILQPAEVLLDLYGEDIRARAYVTRDPVQGEMMLRPDFTVPLVQTHQAGGSGPARYTYSGEVFRMQDRSASGRPTEYLQVGFELVQPSDPVAAEAEVFATIMGALDGLGLQAAMGDIGLLQAAVLGLSTSAERRAALMRHLWRPHRFRTLLDQFSDSSGTSSGRDKLLEKLANEGADRILAEAPPSVGLRSPAEVGARLAALKRDAETPPLSARQVDLIDDLLNVRGAAPAALAALRDLSVDLPMIEPAVQRLSARYDALNARGVDLGSVLFEATYGRTALEYYDGFVFGFYDEQRLDLPPVATGGRYDALTRALGQEVPAVGGVVRPALVVEVQG
ncbi:MAG: ATP phosphoribosyltransferase regulatory subunit [Pseudomonadota bacterium]